MVRVALHFLYPRHSLKLVGWVTLALNVIIMALGFAIATLAQLNRPTTKALTCDRSGQCSYLLE
ncbi:MAG: hypothetical protein ACFB2W_12215 [Leptolyngbyaceae cyanobacterium]